MIRHSKLSSSLLYLGHIPTNHGATTYHESQGEAGQLFEDHSDNYARITLQLWRHISDSSSANLGNKWIQNLDWVLTIKLHTLPADLRTFWRHSTNTWREAKSATRTGILSFLKIRMNDKKSIEEFLSDIDSDLLQYAGELSFDNQTSKFTRPLWNDLAPHHKRL